MRTNLHKPGVFRAREILSFGAAGFLLTALASMGYVPRPCVGGTLPVATFRLLVVSPNGGTALPVNEVNILNAGDKLKYEPILLPGAIRNRARIAIVIAPSAADKSKNIEVLDARPAKSPAEWTVPVRASVVGVVFGPHGLSVKKVNSLVKNNPELVPELATYAKQTATVNALVDTLSQYEQSKPGSEDLNAALKGFSTQYGVMLPRLTPGAPTDQQATVLLRAVMPAMATYDPLTSSGSAVVQQSAGLAASVAALFYGTPIGLAAGGAALFTNMRTMMFPGTDFRSAFAETAVPSGAELCAKNQQAVPRTRIAYLWMLKMPDTNAPSISLAGARSLPVASQSAVKVMCATNAEMRTLPRARDWQLISRAHSAKVPAKVTVGADNDTLSLDLSHAKLPAGDYRLAALWDWQPLEVMGTIHLRSYSDFSGVKPTPASEDRLIEGAGTVTVDLTGADFEFVNKVAIEKASGSAPQPLTFKLPKGLNEGEQPQMSVSVDTSSLAHGSYHLLLTQGTGKSQGVPIVVHPPNPKIDNLPLRVNLGQPSQVITLHGTGLDRIEAISSKSAAWAVAQANPGSAGTERNATVTLHPGLNDGQVIGASMAVEGIHEDVDLPSALQIAPPRPKIVSVSESFPKAGDVALRPGEIPSGAAASFAFHTYHVTGRPSLAISCSNSGQTRQLINLQPGDQNGQAQLEYAGEGVLFLSLDPGVAGQSGCFLTATVTIPDAGASDPKALGRVILLPQIDKFSLSNERIRGSLYQGNLTGQNLQMIEKTGWNANKGYPVEGIPTSILGSTQEQTLKIALPWPSPSPAAPVYIWLRGESRGRRTSASY
ncbi:MAG: hypothetical protein ACRD18_15370 [Terriglobia bacterium]